MVGPVKVGIIGCGKIFPAYVSGLRRFPERVEIAWCTDIIPERAEQGSKSFNIPHYGWNDDMFADPEVKIVVNLTPPPVHAEVIATALNAGKHVYTEKPLSITPEQGRAVLDLAERTGLELCSAPDTFLGPGGQTAHAAIDSGEIGEPFGFTMFCVYSRLETWHPDPRSYFEVGGGPMLDTGPYFITELINLLGPLKAVTGTESSGPPRRAATAPDAIVNFVNVEIPTHASALIELQSGASGTFVNSYDVWNQSNTAFEVYGSRGTLTVPHPNWFTGDVWIQHLRDRERRLVQPVLPPIENEGLGKPPLRGFGVMDLLDSLDGGAQRTAASRAYHGLEALAAVHRSSDEGRRIVLESTCDRPAPLTTEVYESWR